MIIMIIFLFLTIVMILCTAYYLDYKKRKDNFVEFYHEHYDSEMNK